VTKPAVGAGLELHAATTAIVVVDMQRVFREATAWRVPGFDGILPAVERLAAWDPARAVFTRFWTPAAPEDARGWWRQYYRRWPDVTLNRLPRDRFELVEPLRRFAPPAAVVDKETFSAFAVPAFAEALKRLGADTLVLAGVETDVCVLATALDAVDLGYRAVVVRDATASAAPEAHAAMVETVYPRYEPQIQVATTEEVLTALGTHG